MQDGLAATLLQWTPEDFPFREIAFAVLCLALGERHVTVLPSNILIMEDGLFGNIKSEDHSGTGTAFVSGLATGAHVQGLRPGSSPKEVIYWLEGVLVFLTTQLFRAQAVSDEVSRVAKYCQQYYPEDIVDAVLISIEHVVLIHIIPNTEVQHTALMPLFQVENHLSLDVRDRYASTYLEKLARNDEKIVESDIQFGQRRRGKRRKAGRGMCSDKITEMHFGDTDDDGEGEEEEDLALFLSQRGVKGKPISTLYALMHLFHAAARRRMPYIRPREGRLPAEIYGEIFKRVTDVATRESCMKVSRSFRQLCQEDFFLVEGMNFKPCEAVQACAEPHQVPESFNRHDITSDTLERVEVRRGSRRFDARPDSEPEKSCTVAIGTGRDTKSLLTSLEFGTVRVDPSPTESRLDDDPRKVSVR